MALASGLAAQCGFSEEVTYGTYVAPSRFLPFRSNNIKVAVGSYEAELLGSGLFQTTDQVRTYITGAGGDAEFDVLTKGMGLLLKHMLGAVSTSQPDDQGAPTVYLHTFTPDTASGLAGKSLTFQTGVPDISGTVRPFNFPGSKITAWELACEVGGALTLKTTVDCKTAEHTSALASPSYPAGARSLIFVDGAVSIGGNAAKIKKFSLTGAWGLDTERVFLGNEKLEPLANARWALTGSLDREFDGFGVYDAWVAGTTAAMVLTFSYGEIVTGFPYKLTITIPAIRYTGEAPEVSGPGIVQQPAPYQVLSNGTDPAVTIAYQTTDATP